MSIIRGSSIHSSAGMCVYAEKANNITIENNVIARCTKYAIGAFDTTNNLYIKKNLIVGVYKRPGYDNEVSGLYDMVAGIDIYIPIDNR